MTANSDSTERIVLAGLSGTGKSTVARILAQRLGWTAIDVDKSIEITSGRSIPELFAREGEASFRTLERSELHRALEQSHVVIATGGGAVVADDAWSTDCLRSPGTLTVALDGDPTKLIERLRAHVAVSNETVERPLLAGTDPLGRLIKMKSDRQTAYDRADLTLPVDEVTAQQVAETIALLLRPGDEPKAHLSASGAESLIYVKTAIAQEIGDRINVRWPRARSAWVITDANVGALHAAPIVDTLIGCGLKARTITVPPGEGSKSWESAGVVIGQLLDEGIQRNDVVVALGGGVIGDLAGFAAATVLRGVGLVQVPTSLLAMVDSSVGGKTGINHSTGKNLIGAFYQPPLVLIDPTFLKTLPTRELNQGWAEVVKHAFIQSSTPDRTSADLESLLTRNKTGLLDLREPITSYVISRNVQLKASVVEADEREASLRAILNFGHTLGHAIEASDYRYLHGEAVALGLRAAIRIGRLRESIDDARELSMNSLITDFGLPVTGEFDLDRVFEKMKSDKKNTAGTQTWVLPKQDGGVELVTGVDEATVVRAANSVLTNSVQAQEA
jgi:3-dehydroquinate synthase